MTKLQEVLQFITEKQKDYDFDALEYIDHNELQQAIEDNSMRDYLESLNENREITDTEIIYYARAIEYIKENDPSMHECFEIASEYGYETKHLNSELLASLLATRRNEEDYYEFIEAVIEFTNE